MPSRPTTRETSNSGRWARIRLPRNSRDLLHAANLRHGTGGFTSLPKEGVLRIFSPLKSDGFEPANLGTKGQHATSRPPKPITYIYIYIYIYIHTYIYSGLFNSLVLSFYQTFIIYIKQRCACANHEGMLNLCIGRSLTESDDFRCCINTI